MSSYLSSLFELSISFGPDLSLPSGEHIRWGDVTDSAVEADLIVVIHESGDHLASVLGIGGFEAPNRVVFDRAMEAFDLAVGLGIVRRSSHVGHAGVSDEALEVPGNEGGAIVGDEPGSSLGEALASPLQDDLDILLRHRLAKLPVE